MKKTTHRLNIESPKVPIKETTIGTVQNEAPDMPVVSQDEFHA